MRWRGGLTGEEAKQAAGSNCGLRGLGGFDYVSKRLN